MKKGWGGQQSSGFLRRFIHNWHPEAIKILVAAIIAVAIGIEVFVLMSQERAKELEFLSEGTRAIGTVVEKDSLYTKEAGASGHYNYYVYYAFSSPSGERLKGHGEIGYQLWHQLDVGSSIEIVYDPVDPSHNLPVAAERPGVWGCYLGAIVLAGGFFLLVRYVLLPLVIRSVNKMKLKRGWLE